VFWGGCWGGVVRNVYKLCTQIGNFFWGVFPPFFVVVLPLFLWCVGDFFQTKFLLWFFPRVKFFSPTTLTHSPKVRE
jgi:hypothetical protein